MEWEGSRQTHEISETARTLCSSLSGDIVKYPRLPPTAAAAAAEQQSYHPQDLNITFQAISSVYRSSDTTRALNMQAIKCVVVGDG